MMLSGTTHKHVIHAGYAFGGSGDWILRDGVFSCHDLESALHDPEVEQALRKQRFHTLHVHCSPEGSWRQPPVGVSLNPPDIVDQLAGSNHLLSCLDTVLTSPPLTSLLPSSSVVGNIRFRRPTMYVFPGGQGDCALFGVTGFTLLVDGGFARKPCFWEFVRHLDRLDSVLVTRFNQFNSCGLTALAQRKALERVYPQVGHVFCNAVKSPSDEELQKDRDQLLVSVVAQGLEFLQGVREMGLAPQACRQDQHPLTLYHKVGHGTLEMYVLSPGRANDEDSSVCVLLVWRPAKVSEPVTRILLPGSATQSVIFEGLKKLSHLSVLKSRAVTAETRIGLKKPKVQEKPVRAASVPPRPGVARRATGKVESPSPSPTPPEKPKATSKVKANKPVEHIAKRQVEEQKKTAHKAAKKEPKKTAIDKIAEQVDEKKEDKLSVKDETTAIENMIDKNNIVESLSKKDQDDILDKELTNLITDKTLEKTKGEARKVDTTEPGDRHKPTEKASAKREVKKVTQPKPTAKSKGAKDVTNKKTVEAKAVARKAIEPTKAKPRPAVTPPTKPLVRDSRSKSPASSASSSPKHAPSKPTHERPVRSVRGGARTAKQALAALEGAVDVALSKAGEKPTAQVKPDKRIELVSQSADESSTSREAIEEKEATEATKEEKPSFEGVGTSESHKETIESDQLEEPLPEALDKLHVQGEIIPPEEIILHEAVVGLQDTGREEKASEQKPSDEKGELDELDHVPSPEPTVSASSEGVPSLEDEILEISPRDNVSVPPCALEADLSRVRALSSGQRTPDSLDTPREVGDGTAPSTEQDILAAMEKHKLVSREQVAEMKRRDSLDSIEGEVPIEEEEAAPLHLDAEKMAPVCSEQAKPWEAESNIHQLKEVGLSPELKAPFEITVDTVHSTEILEEKTRVTPQGADIEQQPGLITPSVIPDNKIDGDEVAPQSQEKLLATSQVSYKDEKDQDVTRRDERSSSTDHNLREDEGNKKATARSPLVTENSQVPKSKRDSLLSDDNEMQDYNFVKRAENALDKKESEKEEIRELKDQISALEKEASDVQQASVVSDAEMVPPEAISRKSSQVLPSAEMTPGAEPLTAEDISAGEPHGDHEAFLTTAENEDAKKEHPSLPKSKPEKVTEKEMPDIPGEAKPMQQFVEPEVIKGKIFQAVQPDDGSFSSESLVEKDFLEHAKRKDEEEQKADESLGDVCDIPVGSGGLEEAEIKPSDVASRPVEHLPTDEDIQLHAREPPSIKDKHPQETLKHLKSDQTETSKPEDDEPKEQEIKPMKSERKQSAEVITAFTEEIISDSAKQHSPKEDMNKTNELELYQEQTAAPPEKRCAGQTEQKQEKPALSVEDVHIEKTDHEIKSDISFTSLAIQDLGVEQASYPEPDYKTEDFETPSIAKGSSSPTAPDSGIYEETTELPREQPEMRPHEIATEDGDTSTTPITLKPERTTGLEPSKVETAENIVDEPEVLIRTKTEAPCLQKFEDLQPKHEVFLPGERKIAQDKEQEPSKAAATMLSDENAVEPEESQRPRIGHAHSEMPQSTEAEETTLDISISPESEKTDTRLKEPFLQDEVGGRDGEPGASVIPQAVVETRKESAETTDTKIVMEKEKTHEFSDDKPSFQKDKESSKALEPEHDPSEKDKPIEVSEDSNQNFQEDIIGGKFSKPLEDMDTQDESIPQTKKSVGEEEEEGKEPRKLEEPTPRVTSSLGGYPDDLSTLTQDTSSQTTAQTVQSPKQTDLKPLISRDEERSLTKGSDSSELQATAPGVETLAPEEQKRPEERSVTQQREIDTPGERDSEPMSEADDKVSEKQATTDLEKLRDDHERQDELTFDESHFHGIPDARAPQTKGKEAPDVLVRETEPPKLDEMPVKLPTHSEEKNDEPRLVEDLAIKELDSEILQQDLNLVEDALKATADLVNYSAPILSQLDETQSELSRDKLPSSEDLSGVKAITPTIAASEEAVPPVRKKRELADDEDHYIHPLESAVRDILDEDAYLKTTKKPRKDSKSDDETLAVSEKISGPGQHEGQPQRRIEVQSISDDSVSDLPGDTAATLPEPAEQTKRDYPELDDDDISKETEEPKEADRLQQRQLKQHLSTPDEMTATMGKVPQNISGEDKSRIDQFDLPQKDFGVKKLLGDQNAQETPARSTSDGYYQTTLELKTEEAKHKIGEEPPDRPAFTDLNERKPSRGAVKELFEDITGPTGQSKITTEESVIPVEPVAIEDHEKLVVSFTSDQSEGGVSPDFPTKEAEKQDQTKPGTQEELLEDVCLSKRESTVAIQKDSDRDETSVESPHIIDTEHHKPEEPKDTCHTSADKLSPTELENEAFTDDDEGAQKQEENIEDVENTSLLMSEKETEPPYLPSEAKVPSSGETTKQPDPQHRDKLSGVIGTNVREDFPREDEDTTREHIIDEHHKEEVPGTSGLGKRDEDIAEQPVPSTRTQPSKEEAGVALTSPSLDQSHKTDVEEVDMDVPVQKQETAVYEKSPDMGVGIHVGDKKEVEKPQEEIKYVLSDLEPHAAEHDVILPSQATLVKSEIPATLDTSTVEAVDHSEAPQTVLEKLIPGAHHQINDDVLLEDLKAFKADSEEVTEGMEATFPTDVNLNVKQSLEIPLAKALQDEVTEEDAIVPKEGVSTGFDFRSPSEVLKVHLPKPEKESDINEVFAESALLQDASPNEDDKLLLESLKQEIIDECLLQSEMFPSHVPLSQHHDVPPADSLNELNDKAPSDKAPTVFAEQVEQRPEARQVLPGDHASAEEIGKICVEDDTDVRPTVPLFAHVSEEKVTQSFLPSAAEDLHHEDAHKILSADKPEDMLAEESSLPASDLPDTVSLSRESPLKDGLIDKQDGSSPSEESAEHPGKIPQVMKDQHSEEPEQQDGEDDSYLPDDSLPVVQTTRAPDDTRDEEVPSKQSDTLEPNERKQKPEDRKGLDSSKELPEEALDKPSRALGSEMRFPQHDIDTHMSDTSKVYETATSVLEASADVADVDQAPPAKSPEQLSVIGSEDVKQDIPAVRDVQETASRPIEDAAPDDGQEAMEYVEEGSRDALESESAERRLNGHDSEFLEHVEPLNYTKPTAHMKKPGIDTEIFLSDTKEDLEKVSMETTLAPSSENVLGDVVPVILGKSFTEERPQTSSLPVAKEDYEELTKTSKIKASEHEDLKGTSSEILTKLPDSTSSKSEELVVSSADEVVKEIKKPEPDQDFNNILKDKQEDVKEATEVKSDVCESLDTQKSFRVAPTVDEENITPDVLLSGTESVKDELPIRVRQNGSDEALDKIDIEKSEGLSEEGEFRTPDDDRQSSPSTSHVIQESSEAGIILKKVREPEGIAEITDHSKASRIETPLVSEPTLEIKVISPLEDPKTRDISQQSEVQAAQDLGEKTEKIDDKIHENGSPNIQYVESVPKVLSVDVHAEETNLAWKEKETEPELHKETIPCDISVEPAETEDISSKKVPDQVPEEKTKESKQPPAKPSGAVDAHELNQGFIEKLTDTLPAPEHDTGKQEPTKDAVLANSEIKLPVLPKSMSVPDREDLISCGTLQDGKIMQTKTETDVLPKDGTKYQVKTMEDHVNDAETPKIGIIANLVEQGVEGVGDWMRTSIHKDQIQEPDSSRKRDDKSAVRSQEEFEKYQVEKSYDKMSQETISQTEELNQQYELQRGTCTSTEDERKDRVEDDRRSTEETPTEVDDMTSKAKTELLEPSKPKEQTIPASEAPLQDPTEIQKIDTGEKHDKINKIPEDEASHLKVDLEHPVTTVLVTKVSDVAETLKDVVGKGIEDDEKCDDKLAEDYISLTEEAVVRTTFAPTTYAKHFLPSISDDLTAVDSQDLLSEKSISGETTQQEVPWSGHTGDETEAMKDPSVEITDQPIKDPRASISLTEDPTLTLSQKRPSLEYESSITSVSDTECGPEDKGLKVPPSDSGSEALKETSVVDGEGSRSSPDVSLPSSPVDKIPQDCSGLSKKGRTPTDSKPSIFPQESSEADISSEGDDSPPKKPASIESVKAQDTFSEKAPTAGDDVVAPKDLPSIDRDIAAHEVAAADYSKKEHSNGMTDDGGVQSDTSHIEKAATEDSAQASRLVECPPGQQYLTSGADDELQGQSETLIVSRKSSTSLGSSEPEKADVYGTEYRESENYMPLLTHDQKYATHKEGDFSLPEDTIERRGSLVPISTTEAEVPSERNELSCRPDSSTKDMTNAMAEETTEKRSALQLSEKHEAAGEESFTVSKQPEPSTVPMSDSRPVPEQMQDDSTSLYKLPEQKQQIGSSAKNIALPSSQSVSARDIEILDDYTKRLNLTRDDRVSVDSIFSLTSEERSYAELEKPDYNDEVAHITNEGIEKGSLYDNKDEGREDFKREISQEQLGPKHFEQTDMTEMDVEKDRIFDFSSSKKHVAPVEPESSLAEELAKTEEPARTPERAFSDSMFASSSVVPTTSFKEDESESPQDDAKKKEPVAHNIKSPTHSDVPQHGIVSGLLAALRTELCVIDSADLLKEGVLDETETIVTPQSEKTSSGSMENIPQKKIDEDLKPLDELTSGLSKISRDQGMDASEHKTPFEEPHMKIDQSEVVSDETTENAKITAEKTLSGVVGILGGKIRKEPEEELHGAATETEIVDETEQGELTKEEANQIKVIRFQLHDEHSAKTGLKKPLSLIPEDYPTPSTAFGTLDDEDKTSTLFEQAVRLEQSHEAAFLEGATTDEEDTSLKLSQPDHQDDVPARTQSTEPTTQAVIPTEEKELDEEGPTLAAALSSALPTELVCMVQSSTDLQKDISSLAKTLGSMELEPSVSHKPDTEEEPVAVAVGLASGLPVELVCVMESEEVCSEIKRAGKEAAHKASEKSAELTKAIPPETDAQISMFEESQPKKLQAPAEDECQTQGGRKEPFHGEIDAERVPLLSHKQKSDEKSGGIEHFDAKQEEHEHDDQSPSDAKPPLSPSVGLVAGLAAGLATELVCIPQSLEGICKDPLETEWPSTKVTTHGIVMGSPKTEISAEHAVSSKTAQGLEMHDQQQLSEAGYIDEGSRPLRHVTMEPGTHRIITTSTTYQAEHPSDAHPNDTGFKRDDVLDRSLTDGSEGTTVTYVYKTGDSAEGGTLWERSVTGAPGSFDFAEEGLPTTPQTSGVLEPRSPHQEEHKENEETSGGSVRRQVYEFPADREDQDTLISRSDDSGISFPEHAGSSIQKVAMEEVARITELATSALSESLNGQFSMRASDSSAQRPLELLRPVRPVEGEEERNVTHVTQVRQVVYHPSSSSEMHFPMGYPAEETCLPPEGSDPQTILQFMAAQTKQAAKEMLEEQPLYEEDEECAMEQSLTSDASPLVEEPVFAKTLQPDYPELVELSGGNTPSEPPSPRSPFDSRTKHNGESTSSVQRMVVIEESEAPSSPSRTHIHRITRRVVEGPVTEIQETWTLQGDVAGLQALPEASSRILLGSVQQSETSFEPRDGATRDSTRDQVWQELPRAEQDIVQQASWKTTVVETRHVPVPGDSASADSHDNGVTAFRGAPEERNGNRGGAPFNIDDWGEPLGLPVLPEPPRSYDTLSSKTSRTKKAQQGDVVYVDLTYVPHHGDPAYCDVEFFNRVRARYYVLSGTSPSQDVLNALLEAKRGWDDPDVPVTVIPTYETDALCYWIALNQKALEEQKIDVAPSASRCTINLQDHESSCAAYRLEF
ncbi:unnamed protein product [Ixodes persulcatus]